MANKGLRLDVTSTFNDEGFKWVVFSVGCRSDSSTARSKRRLAGDSLDWKEKESEGAHPRCFAKRVCMLLKTKRASEEMRGKRDQEAASC